MESDLNDMERPVPNPQGGGGNQSRVAALGLWPWPTWARNSVVERRLAGRDSRLIKDRQCPYPRRLRCARRIIKDAIDKMGRRLLLYIVT
jgi:hypothetical protein